MNNLIVIIDRNKLDNQHHKYRAEELSQIIKKLNFNCKWYINSSEFLSKHTQDFKKIYLIFLHEGNRAFDQDDFAQIIRICEKNKRPFILYSGDPSDNKILAYSRLKNRLRKTLIFLISKGMPTQKEEIIDIIFSQINQEPASIRLIDTYLFILKPLLVLKILCEGFLLINDMRINKKLTLKITDKQKKEVLDWKWFDPLLTNLQDEEMRKDENILSLLFSEKFNDKLTELWCLLAGKKSDYGEDNIIGSIVDTFPDNENDQLTLIKEISGREFSSMNDVENAFESIGEFLMCSVEKYSVPEFINPSSDLSNVHIKYLDKLRLKNLNIHIACLELWSQDVANNLIISDLVRRNIKRNIRHLVRMFKDNKNSILVGGTIKNFDNFKNKVSITLGDIDNIILNLSQAVFEQ